MERMNQNLIVPRRRQVRLIVTLTAWGHGRGGNAVRRRRLWSRTAGNLAGILMPRWISSPSALVSNCWGKKRSEIMKTGGFRHLKCISRSHQNISNSKEANTQREAGLRPWTEPKAEIRNLMPLTQRLNFLFLLPLNIRLWSERQWTGQPRSKTFTLRLCCYSCGWRHDPVVLGLEGSHMTREETAQSVLNTEKGKGGYIPYLDLKPKLACTSFCFKLQQI